MAPSAPTTSTAATSGASFGDVLSGVDQLQQLQSNADGLAVQAVTGQLDDVHDYTIAAAQASLAIELTAAVRNKAVDAFNEIMRMSA
ncbi:MAG TPA: flagellar hook-basal body complex protein FliE [Cellulomonas sp.]